MNSAEEARSSQKSVLVHCAAGVNRSPTIVIAYLMFSMRWSLKTGKEFISSHSLIFLAAYRHVLSKKASICPHEKYMEQLSKYEVDFPFFFFFFYLPSLLTKKHKNQKDERIWLFDP
jgi:hypothetical protein